MNYNKRNTACNICKENFSCETVYQCKNAFAVLKWLALFILLFATSGAVFWFVAMVFVFLVFLWVVFSFLGLFVLSGSIFLAVFSKIGADAIGFISNKMDKIMEKRTIYVPRNRT